MTLTVRSRRIADGRVRGVGLQPVVGAYELVFGLYLSVSTGKNRLPSASVLGARVVVRPNKGEPQPLGFARPEQPFKLVCQDFVVTPTLHLCLQPSQTAALEALREAEGLTIELSFTGSAADDHGEQNLLGDCSVRVPRSEWLETLQVAGASNAMVLEVPLPIDEQTSDHWRDVASNLRSAEEEYGNGSHRGCIASCRLVIDELGGPGNLKWSRGLNHLAEERHRAMTKVQREEAVYAALRHYAHLAHHGLGDGDETGYTRVEAEFMLSTTVAAVRLGGPVCEGVERMGFIFAKIRGSVGETMETTLSPIPCEPARSLDECCA